MAEEKRIGDIKTNHGRHEIVGEKREDGMWHGVMIDGSERHDVTKIGSHSNFGSLKNTAAKVFKGQGFRRDQPNAPMPVEPAEPEPTNPEGETGSGETESEGDDDGESQLSVDPSSEMPGTIEETQTDG